MTWYHQSNSSLPNSTSSTPASGLNTRSLHCFRMRLMVWSNPLRVPRMVLPSHVTIHTVQLTITSNAADAICHTHAQNISKTKEHIKPQVCIVEYTKIMGPTTFPCFFLHGPICMLAYSAGATPSNFISIIAKKILNMSASSLKLTNIFHN